MAIRSRAQLRAFFAKVHDKHHRSNLKKFEVEKKKLITARQKNLKRLSQQLEESESQSENLLIEKQNSVLQDDISELKRARFERSPVGKGLNNVKGNLKSIAEYEKAHFGSQKKSLKRLWGDLQKLR